MLWTLVGAARESGHTAVEVGVVEAALKGLGVRDAPGAVRAAYEAGRIMAFAERPPSEESAGGDGDFADGSEADGDDDFDAEFGDDFDDVGPGGFQDPFEGPADRLLVALERHALAEESIADAVLRLMSTAGPADDDFGGGSGLGEALRGAAVALYVTGAGEDPPRRRWTSRPAPPGPRAWSSPRRLPTGVRA